MTTWLTLASAGSSVHDFPGKNTGVGVVSFSRGSSRPRDQTHVSYPGRGVLYHWVTQVCTWANVFFWKAIRSKNQVSSPLIWITLKRIRDGSNCWWLLLVDHVGRKISLNVFNLIPPLNFEAEDNWYRSRLKWGHLHPCNVGLDSNGRWEEAALCAAGSWAASPPFTSWRPVAHCPSCRHDHPKCLRMLPEVHWEDSEVTPRWELPL